MSEKVTSQQPNREYEIPGGPKAKNLGEVEVKKLSDFQRGGPEDLRGLRGGRTR